MKKVYCKNCKYILKTKTKTYYTCLIVPKHPDFIDIIGNLNYCRFYRRKWWKFWVK